MYPSDNNKKTKTNFSIERDKVINHLMDGKLIKWKELEKIGINANTVANMVRRDELIKIGWGTYQLSSDLIMEHKEEEDFGFSGDIDTLAEISIQIPKGIICLMTAVTYYNITNDLDSNVWIAIPHSHHKPRIEWPPIRSVHWRNIDLEEDEVNRINFKNTEIKITSKERTVVDLYRHQHLLSDPHISKKALIWLLQNDHNRSALTRISKKFNVYNKIKNDIELIDNVPMEANGLRF